MLCLTPWWGSQKLSHLDVPPDSLTVKLFRGPLRLRPGCWCEIPGKNKSFPDSLGAPLLSPQSWRNLSQPPPRQVGVGCLFTTRKWVSQLTLGTHEGRVLCASVLGHRLPRKWTALSDTSFDSPPVGFGGLNPSLVCTRHTRTLGLHLYVFPRPEPRISFQLTPWFYRGRLSLLRCWVPSK